MKIGIYKYYLHWLNADGDFHREDGPAIEYSDGTKSWYINGKRHREDGPAIERADGSKEWYINGRQHAVKSAGGPKRMIDQRFKGIGVAG